VCSSDLSFYIPREANSPGQHLIDDQLRVERQVHKDEQVRSPRQR
jgi:hypothetical protein